MITSIRSFQSSFLLIVRIFLNKILNTNPKKRFTLEDIKSHPWYNIVKPELSTGYLVGINEFPINNGILDLLEEYNFEKESLLQALKDNKHNHATTSYYLLLKKSEQTKGKAGEPHLTV